MPLHFARSRCGKRCYQSVLVKNFSFLGMITRITKAFTENRIVGDEKWCRLSGVFQVFPPFSQFLNIIFRCGIREITFFSTKNTTSWFRFTKDFCASEQISQYFCIFVMFLGDKTCLFILEKKVFSSGNALIKKWKNVKFVIFRVLDIFDYHS